MTALSNEYVTFKELETKWLNIEDVYKYKEGDYCINKRYLFSFKEYLDFGSTLTKPE
jgi:hypothetical protein